MKALSVLFASIIIACTAPVLGQDDDANLPEIQVHLKPSHAGNLSYDVITLTNAPVDNQIAELNFSLNLFAGWVCVDTVIDYDVDGIPVELTFVAEKLPRSDLADTVVISEISFCAHLTDSLSNWFELTNISNREITLQNAMIQTTAGKQSIATDLKLPSKSCVKVAADSLMMNADKDSVLLLDSENRIISQISWDASSMNLPQDSIFSLEIIDVFKSTADVSNWEIIYGEGRGGLCPQKYAQSLGEGSIWNWLQFVVWGLAAILLVMIIGLSFKKQKK